MSSGDVIKLELQGENAVRRWRELIGPTDSEKVFDQRKAVPRGGERSVLETSEHCMDDWIR